MDDFLTLPAAGGFVVGVQAVEFRRGREIFAQDRFPRFFAGGPEEFLGLGDLAFEGPRSEVTMGMPCVLSGDGDVLILY